MFWKIGDRPRARWSMATRLTLWYAVSAFALAMGSAWVIYATLSATIHRESTIGLSELVDELDREFERSGRLPKEVTDTIVRITDRSGRALLEASFTPEMVRLIPKPDTGAVVVEDTRGRSLRLLSRTVGDRVYTVGYDRRDEAEFLGRFRRAVGLMLVPALAASAIVGFAIVRRGLRPVSDIAATVADIGVDRLGARVDLSPLPRELADLGTSINATLERLETSFSQLDRFSADIAHELRNPVHNLRNAAEIALTRDRSSSEYRDTIGLCLDEADRLATLIDQLLFLARAENPRRQLVREDLDVGDEIVRLCEFFGPAAEEAGLELEARVQGSLRASLNRALFQRAVSNLVSNALAHGLRGGRVIVAAAAEPFGLRVSVEDNGPGIALEHLPHLFDRFYRCDPARTPGRGLGLGLAIARSIAELHGGSASVTSRPSEGTVVTLTFSADPAESARMTRMS